MRKNNFFILFLPLLLAGCQHSLGGGSNLTTYINEGYINEFDSVAIARDRDEISFTSGQSSNNCQFYLKEIKQSTVVESVNDQIIHTEYLVCEVYDLVKDTKITKLSLKEGYGRLLSSKLDLTSFRSSLNRRARTDGPSLKDLGDQFLTIDESSATYETDEWVYSLALLAISDLNQDGIQDWIVLLEDKSKVGNYHTGATLIVLGPMDASSLKAITYSDFIK